MTEQQLNIFDKPKVKLINNFTNMNLRLTKNSIHEVFMEQKEHYIILLDNVFYGIYKTDTRTC
ncbi:MAG: hypothetical protein RSB41_04300 [Bacilli bacterium]